MREPEVHSRQEPYCDKCQLAGRPRELADYCILFNEKDTTQDWEYEEIMYTCLPCTMRIFLSAKGRDVKNYIRIRNNEYKERLNIKEVDYNCERQDIMNIEIMLSTPIPAANNKIGVIRDRMEVGMNAIENKAMWELIVSDLFRRVIDRKMEMGKFPVIR